MPIFSLVIGRMVNTLGYGTPDGLAAQLNETTLFFLYLAIASFLVCYLEVGMWMLTGKSPARHLSFLLILFTLAVCRCMCQLFVLDAAIQQ